MKDLVRLLMVAIMSFALIGGALIYSRDSQVLPHLMEMVAARSPAQDSTIPTSPAAALPAEQTRLWIPRPYPNVWMGLAGFPDAFELRFPVPANIAYTGGTLQLALDTQLAKEGDGRLTVNVNGVRRGELVLDVGEERHDIEIALAPEDLLGPELDVQLVGNGTTNGGQICPTNATSSGSAVTLLSASGLALFTDGPAEDAYTRLAGLAEPMALDLGETTNDQAAAIWIAQALSRAGIDTRFTDSAGAALVLDGPSDAPLALDAQGRVALAGQDGVAALIAARAALLTARPAPESWPVTADALGAETQARTFRGSRHWTLSYRPADLRGGRMPTELNLALKTSVLAAGNDWMVRVSLNDNLLETRRFPGTEADIAMAVSLPVGLEGLRNEITIDLIDTTPNTSICRSGADAEAQLLPSTRLSANGEQPGDGWGAMLRQLAKPETIGLVVGNELTSAQALQARSMLSAFLPAHTRVVFGAEALGAPVRVTILDIQQLRALLPMAEQPPAEAAGDSGLFLVTRGSASSAELTLMDVDEPQTRNVIASLGPANMAILISRPPHR